MNNSNIVKDINYIESLKRKGYIWGTTCAFSAISLLIAITWTEFSAAGLIILLGLISVCSLIMVLKLNAEAVHRQTSEEIAFIHLQTSLPLSITLLVPVIGIWFTIRTASMALRGKYIRSGGTLKETPPPHLIGGTSVHLGILLMILTIVIQGIWLIILWGNFTR